MEEVPTIGSCDSISDSLDCVLGYRHLLDNTTQAFLDELSYIMQDEDSEKYPTEQQLQEIVQHNMEMLAQVKFDSNRDLLNCVKTAGSSFLGEPIENDNVIKLGGGSGDEVFHVKGDENSIILKAFKNINETNRFHELYKESIALNIINNLSLKFADSPKLLGISSCVFEDGTYVLLYQEFLGEKTLKSYVEEIKEYELGSKERISALEQTKEMFFIFGRGLSEFHFVNSKEQYEYIPTKMVNLYKTTLDSAVAKLELYNRKQIDVLSLRYLFEDNLHMMETTPLKLGFSHGDTHFGNLLIGKKEGRDILQIIDVVRAFNSMTKNLTPIGIPQLDYYFLTDFFFPLREERAMKTGNKYLSTEEAVTLISSYKKGYNSLGNSHNLKYESDFFILYELLVFVNMSFKEHLTLDHYTMKTPMDRYFWVGTDIALSWLKKKVEEYKNSSYCIN